MASRATIRAAVLRYLGTTSDDPMYLPATLDPIIQEACDSLRADIDIQNPGYNSTTVTLAADSASARTYTFSTQSAPITDFRSWLEVRWTDANGLELHECRVEELKDADADHFVITGVDSAPTLTVSPDSQAGAALWLRYGTHDTDLASDASVPGGIPLKYHDVIALECVFAFALGGEEAVPDMLFRRWLDRRGQLMHHVGKRGVQPSGTRVYG